MTAKLLLFMKHSQIAPQTEQFLKDKCFYLMNSLKSDKITALSPMTA